MTPKGNRVTRLRLRLGYYITPCQRLWLYNGAPLVAFYDTLGIRWTFYRLKPPACSRGDRVTRGRRDLLYESKVHGDLFGRFDRFYYPTGNRVMRGRRDLENNSYASNVTISRKITLISLLDNTKMK